LVHLSTAVGSKYSDRTWVNIQSARWVNIQSARTEVALNLGVEYRAEESRSHSFNRIIFDIAKADSKIKKLKKSNPEKLTHIRHILSVANQVADYRSICKLPPVTVDQHVEAGEEIHSKGLIATWPDMVSFLEGKAFNVRACSAVA
jgi:hypothetical protein